MQHPGSYFFPAQLGIQILHSFRLDFSWNAEKWPTEVKTELGIFCPASRKAEGHSREPKGEAHPWEYLGARFINWKGRLQP